MYEFKQNLENLDHTKYIICKYVIQLILLLYEIKSYQEIRYMINLHHVKPTKYAFHMLKMTIWLICGYLFISTSMYVPLPQH